ncbi:uncharacterized protein LOC120647456 [Panicum virgatum]|uniref:uncharacterized protein LOC120647456 n=1 Tax=Panicum virgatum TaxID=38727 RepID=UPI0019D61773|nr:uncharacterized protein LOC120647456 [Panicum virgatum]
MTATSPDTFPLRWPWSFKEHVSSKRPNNRSEQNQTALPPLASSPAARKQGNKAATSVVVLDGSTVRAFMADEAAFARSVDARFAALDANGDGVLSRAELRRTLESFRLLDGAGFGSARPAPLPAEVTALYDAVFEQFDADHSGAVDRTEFRDEMRRIMLAVAEGLGSQPLQVCASKELALLRSLVATHVPCRLLVFGLSPQLLALARLNSGVGAGSGAATAFVTDSADDTDAARHVLISGRQAGGEQLASEEGGRRR